MKWKPVLSVIISAILYSVFLFINRIFLKDRIEPLAFAWGCAVFGAVYALAYILATHSFGDLKKIPTKSWWNILFLSLFGTIFIRTLLVFGQSMTTATNTAFIQRTAPVFALLFSIFLLKEKIQAKKILYLSMMIIGVFLLSVVDKFSASLGNILIMGTAIGIGFDQAYSRKIIKNGVSPYLLTALIYLSGFVFQSLITLLFSKFPTSGYGIFAISGFLLIASILFRNIGLDTLKAGVVSSLLLLVPVFTAILGFVFLGESFSFMQYIGAFLILGFGFLLMS